MIGRQRQPPVTLLLIVSKIIGKSHRYCVTSDTAESQMDRFSPIERLPNDLLFHRLSATLALFSEQNIEHRNTSFVKSDISMYQAT